MKKLAVVGVVVIVVGGYWIIGRFSQAHKVSSLVDRQVELWNEGDAQGLYATFSPTMQARCPFETFSSVMETAQALPNAHDLSIGIQGVEVAAGTAQVTGVVKASGDIVNVIQAGDPMIYVETADGWKLDSGSARADTACATGLLPGH